MLAAVFGLSSAAAYGASDFMGGFISKRYASYTVVFTSQLISLGAYFALVILTREALPEPRYLLLGALGGIGGVIGINALYRGLAGGNMALVASVSAVLAAIMPVMWGISRDGAPALTQWLGFVLALAAVWLVSSGGKMGTVRWNDLKLALLAGVCFGIMFIFVSEATRTAVFWPLIALRMVTVPTTLIVILLTRTPAFVRPRDLPVTAAAGVLDGLANATFALAAQVGRLDIASVLSSLYPSVTVFLAVIVLKERINALQRVGVLLALVAVVLITIKVA